MSEVKEMVTAEMFERITGRKPKDDDLDRVNCDKAGEIGHYCCGMCEDCGKPVMDCMCQFKTRKWNWANK